MLQMRAAAMEYRRETERQDKRQDINSVYK